MHNILNNSDLIHKRIGIKIVTKLKGTKFHLKYYVTIDKFLQVQVV